ALRDAEIADRADRRYLRMQSLPPAGTWRYSPRTSLEWIQRRLSEPADSLSSARRGPASERLNQPALCLAASAARPPIADPRGAGIVPASLFLLIRPPLSASRRS